MDSKTINLWRISKFNSLSGEGGLHYSARWHTAGRRIVYLAESPAGAMIESLVHMELNQRSWPEFYDLMQVAAPTDIAIETIGVPPEKVTEASKEKSKKKSAEKIDAKSWKESPTITRALGDEWLRSRRTALARVPSVILLNTWNMLLNPEHPEAAQIKIVQISRAQFDPRLFPKVV